MLYNKEDVMSFLPHRDPFLFIDSVEKIEPIDGRVLGANETVPLKEIVGLSIHCHFYVDENLPLFKGHFPGRPIFPGVIQVEMMAQASCFGVSKSLQNPLEKEIEVAFMGVNNVKFRKPVLPGMSLRVVSICTRVRGVVMSYVCKIYNGEELVSEAEIMASVKVK